MIVAVLQARTSSSRLPGKVLADLAGTPMLLRQIERIRRSRRIDRLVVATSTAEEDDRLAQLCDANGIACHRGRLRAVRRCVVRQAGQFLRAIGRPPLG